MAKELVKPEGLTNTDMEKAADMYNNEALPPVSAYGEIDTERDGTEVGAITTEKFEFEKEGDRLVGFLHSRKEISMPDNPIVYEVENSDGDWSFFGSRLVNGRLAEVPDKIFLDITYLGWRMSNVGGRKYKDYRIKYYIPPTGFDPDRLKLKLSQDGKKILFIDAPMGTKEKQPF